MSATAERAVLLAAPGGPIREAIAETLRDEGWLVVTPDGPAGPLRALVVVAETPQRRHPGSFAEEAFAVLHEIETAITVARQRFTAEGAAIVVVSPALGSEVVAGLAGASLVQRGVAGLVRGLAVEWGDDGVRANAVLPGVIAPAEPLPGVIPLVRGGDVDRRGTAQDIADAVAFLVSDDAGYITGIELVVDGGLSQCRSSATYALWDAGITTAFTTAQERTV
jgi:NAD(P)-dependent dehydrogenase (short-subunit alcohol dehydrogenase family)